LTRRQFLALLLPLLAVLAAFTVLLALERSGVPGAPPWDERFAQYVRDRMTQDFVSGTGDTRHQWEAYFNSLNAYVQTYDSYAQIVPPWLVEESREHSSGQYGGIGVRIEDLRAREGSEAGVRVIGVKPGGPAATAGVVVGDVIIGVDGGPLPERSADAEADPLQEAIRGPEGTAVVLRLRGPDGTERDAPVVRAQIDTGSVLGVRMVDPERGIGYARLLAFQAHTAADLRAALTQLDAAGLHSLILDLRNNAGGLMDQAVAIADLFLDEGVILRQRGRSREYTEVYHATPDATWNATMPLAVLINEGSASASEILAGALQDHRRAVLVGVRTHGKFLVQVVESVPTDAGTALFKRTTSIYETPLGHHYPRRAPGAQEDPLAGIAPDLQVPLAREDRERLRSVFLDEFYADWNPAREPSVVDFVDPQLEAARALLAGEAIAPLLPGPEE